MNRSSDTHLFLRITWLGKGEEEMGAYIQLKLTKRSWIVNVQVTVECYSQLSFHSLSIEKKPLAPNQSEKKYQQN